MKIFFAGEGPDDIGEWANEPAYRPRPEDPVPLGGILHALVAKFTRHDTVDARRWKEVRKFRVGKHDAPETQTVLGLALRAEELGCMALVFARDRDRDEARERDVEAGIVGAERFAVAVVGGTANEEIEAWLLAILGERRSEGFADPKTVLAERHGVDSRTAKIAVVESANLGALPPDCSSLVRWLARAKVVLSSE